jgi:hypothetical protein
VTQSCQDIGIINQAPWKAGVPSKQLAALSLNETLYSVTLALNTSEVAEPMEIEMAPPPAGNTTNKRHHHDATRAR